MNRQELSKNCWLILGTAGRWLEEQDELTCAIHQETVEAIQISTDVTLDLVLYSFKRNYRRIWKSYGKAEIERRAAAFLDSEFEPVSVLFNAFYAEFNTRYFGGRSTPYRVKIRHHIPLPPNPIDYGISCIDKSERQLSIAYNGWPADMLSSLVLRMASIETGCQRDNFFENDQLTRLSELGAPTRENVQRFREAGWDF